MVEGRITENIRMCASPVVYRLTKKDIDFVNSYYKLSPIIFNSANSRLNLLQYPSGNRQRGDSETWAFFGGCGFDSSVQSPTGWNTRALGIWVVHLFSFIISQLL